MWNRSASSIFGKSGEKDENLEDVSSNASDAVDDTCHSLQDTLKSGLQKTQDYFSSSKGANIQEKLKRGNVPVQKVQDYLPGGLGAALQEKLKRGSSPLQKTQDTVSDLTDSLAQSGKAKLSKTQDALQDSRDNIAGTARQAQDTFSQSAHQAQDTVSQSARQAQKKLKKSLNHAKDFTQDSDDDSLADTFGQTQANLKKSAQKAQKKVQKGTGSSLFSQKSEEDLHAEQDEKEQRHYQRKRARTSFRVGILGGIALALAFTPITGEQARTKVKELWQKWNTKAQQ